MAKTERLFAERSSFEAADINANIARMGTGPSTAKTSRIGRGRGIDQTVDLEIPDGGEM
jgi:hypothetical protein